MVTTDIQKYRPLKVALLSCGLGHIKRGIETWTDDLGRVLSAYGMDVTVYKGAGRPETSYERVVPCVTRNSELSCKILRMRPKFLWRLGLSTPYTLEETTFTYRLLPELIAKQYDILHTQDPDVAYILQNFARAKILRSKVILAHGTEETFKFLGHFDHIQHLAPFHLEETKAQGFHKDKWYAIGNFVDTDLFKPGQPRTLHKELGIADDAFVVLCVAAIKKTHKRIDYLIDEISRIHDDKVVLVVAGSKGDQSPELIEKGNRQLGKRMVFLTDFPHDRIHEVYAMADVFTLCSLKEMMPIALLESIASGVPAIVHRYPVEEWMIGEGGEAIDMAKEGALAEGINRYRDSVYRNAKAAKAREHAVKNFSTDVILKQIIHMYKDILS